MTGRYFVCICCGHMMTDTQQKALRFAVNCPTCNRHETFGDGVYVPDFEGYEFEKARSYSVANRMRWDGKRWPSKQGGAA